MAKDKRRELSGNTSITKLNDYFSLRNEIDLLCLKLEEAHKGHISCFAGCHQCCMDFSIFPVEFYSILQETDGRKININHDVSRSECVFLIEGLCSIYESRPLICRTHGLPLLYMGEDEWQLSYCELNFTGSNMPEFNESNTIPQDRFNSRLFMLNKAFIKSLDENNYSETDLIPLRELGVLIKKHSMLCALRSRLNATSAPPNS
jgi:Fe-S-cluster containining protein